MVSTPKHDAVTEALSQFMSVVEEDDASCKGREQDSFQLVDCATRHDLSGNFNSEFCWFFQVISCEVRKCIVFTGFIAVADSP